MQITKTKIYLGVILVFLGGVLIGIVGTGLYCKEQFVRFVSGEPMGRKGFIMRTLSAELDLTPDQRPEIEKIVDSSFLELQRLRQKYQPEVHTILEKSFLSMKERLNPEQQHKLDQLYERMQKRWHMRKSRFR